jgi:lipopolysaccharide export system ATP-binding protein
MPVTIKTTNLVKRYGQRTVVNHVSIEVGQGEIVGLLGPNGAGKTTTFYQVVGLIKPDEGNVFLNDTNITKLPMYKRAKLGIGYLPQEASIFRKLSIEDNIMAVLEMTKLNRKDRHLKLESLLNEFRLQHVRNSNGDVVSGGERRRTEIARALAVNPNFILLDEPFAGIDPIAVEDIQAIVAKMKYKNIGILITDHNVTETLSICDRAYLLIEGKIFKHGSAEELAADEDVRRLYLGRNFELRRKDYLHDEAREHRKATFENIINSVETILGIYRKANEPDVIIIEGEGTMIVGSETENKIGLNEVKTMLTELQQSLIQFSKENNRPEVLSSADKLLASNTDIDAELNTILLHLRTDWN